MTRLQPPAPQRPVARRSARERLLDTANRLFYRDGVHTVGIDRILAESGVAKRSLYTNFGSKDALVAAYLQHRHDGTTRRLTDAIARLDDPRERVLAVFDVQARTFAEPGFNGCAFMNAESEAEPDGVVAEAATAFRAWIHAMFLDLAVDVGAARPERLARQLHALYDGGIVAARDDHDPTIAADTRAAAETMIDAHTGQ